MTQFTWEKEIISAKEDWKQTASIRNERKSKKTQPQKNKETFQTQTL